MGFIKQWRRQGKQLQRRGRADPAIRDSWISLYYSVLTEVRPRSHMPSTWRSLFENLDGGPPCRQELEWWRAMYLMNLGPRTRNMYVASVEAINEMLPDAADGPSDESYRAFDGSESE